MPESIPHYFEHIPSAHRSLILVCGLLFFWLLEGAFPLFRLQYNRWKHAGVNIFFTITTVVVNVAFAIAIVHTSDWAVAHRFGLLYLAPLPLWAEALLGIMILDLVGAWVIHWMQHKVRWMWQFHLIHHTDTKVDTTTANRHHPGESVFRAVFTLLAVVVAGAPMWLVMFYQSLSVVFAQFNHANIGLPAGVDRVLSWVIVSPNMHKVHHHYRLPLTDTNYGNIFSFWDRLFGTYVFEKPANLTYGLDTHPLPKENSDVGNLLHLPFQPYRPHK